MQIFQRKNKLQFRLIKLLHVLVITFLFIVTGNIKIMAQENKQMVRLARIKVDALQLEKYRAALKQQITTAIRVEPGVLTYYAVADKNDPSSITILEIYKDTSAYQLHTSSPHFKKYKETVKDMVKSLQLIDVNLIAFAKKPGM